jgi:hypothetical protein
LIARKREFISLIKMIASITLTGTFLPGFLAVALLTGCRQSSSTPENSSAASTSAEKIAHDMIGTWVQVGRPGQVGEAPTNGGRFKYRTGTHWTVFSVERDTGLVTENFGGSYTMKGDEYVETQAFADETWLRDNGKSFKFIVKIDGDLMTQLGVDNAYNEVWKRVKNVPAKAGNE